MSKRTKSFSDDWLSSVSQQLILTFLKTKEVPLLVLVNLLVCSIYLKISDQPASSFKD